MDPGEELFGKAACLATTIKSLERKEHFEIAYTSLNIWICILNRPKV